MPKLVVFRGDAIEAELVLTGRTVRIGRDAQNDLVVNDATNGVSQGAPQPLFPTQIRGFDNRPYAVDKKGQRFLLKVVSDPQIVVVMDWRTLLDR